MSDYRKWSRVKTIPQNGEVIEVDMTKASTHGQQVFDRNYNYADDPLGSENGPMASNQRIRGRKSWAKNG